MQLKALNIRGNAATTTITYHRHYIRVAGNNTMAKMKALRDLAMGHNMRRYILPLGNTAS